MVTSPSPQTIQLDNIEDAITDLQNGKMIIVVDDENRENEGDFIIAAEFVTPEVINFMTKVARGLICVSLTEERCDELELNMMVRYSNAKHQTAFTVSVDYLLDGCTTGISAEDRSKTVQALVNPATKPNDLGRPGHIFPLKAVQEGVLRRAGHTEAAIDFARLAGCQPVGVLVEILNEDGTMARLPQLRILADEHNFKLVSIADLIKYRLRHESLILKESTVKMPTQYGDFILHAYKQKHTEENHLALVKGSWQPDEPILVRVHSSCVTGDIFGSYRCDCGEQLHYAMQMVQQAGKGVILYMNQEGRGIGLINKLKAYELQEQGMDTVQANVHLGFKPDQRDYGIGAQILRDLGVSKMQLISNNPNKKTGLIGYGLEIVAQIPIEIPANEHNSKYLDTKKTKMGHEFHE